MSTVYRLGPATPIQCHAWAADRRALALSHNNNEVEVWEQGGAGGWREVERLEQHDLRVNDIDWAPNTNRIVTCSADRNAYVWIKGKISYKRKVLTLEQSF